MANSVPAFPHVIMIVSSAATFFPVIAKRVPRLRIPLCVYLFARYFGAGVIVATASIHLLDPAYSEIGPQTCVGMTGGWAQYSSCPAIVLTSVMMIFLLDFGAERYVEMKYGVHSEQDIQGAITNDVDDTTTNNTKSESTFPANGTANEASHHISGSFHLHRPSAATTTTLPAHHYDEETLTADDNTARSQSFANKLPPSSSSNSA